MTIFELIRHCVRNRVMIGSAALLVAVITAGVALWMRPVYRAEVTMLPASLPDTGAGGLSGIAGQLGGLASLAGVGGGGKTTKDQALAILRSRVLIGQFVTDRKLMPVLFEKQWDAVHQRWKSDDVAKQPTAGDAYKAITDNILSVSDDVKTGLVTLRVDWYDRNVAADWANDLVKRTNEAMRSRAVHDADESLKYLTAQLGNTDGLELRAAIVRLIEAQMKSRMIAIVTEEYAFRVLDPAVAPDLNKRLKPKRTLMVLFGALVGAILGLFVTLYRREVA